MYRAIDAIRPHFEALARIGFYKLVTKKETPLKRSIHNYYRTIIWFIVVIYNLQHICRVIQVRHSTGDMVDTLCILFTTSNSFIKLVAFNFRARRIDNIFAVINGPMFKTSNKTHENFVKSNASRMLRMLKFNTSCAILSSALFSIFPLLNWVLGENVELAAYFPFETSRSPKFELALAYYWLATTLAAYGTVTMDCTVVSLYSQARTQLQVLRFNLEHIGDFDEDIADESHVLKCRDRDLSNEKCNFLLHRRFVRCIKHQHLIIWYVKEVQSIFGEAMVVQFVVISWVICMTLYKIVTLSILSAQFLSMAVYLVCMLIQLFIYCYCGTQLQQESELVSQSIYFSGWTSMSLVMRRGLILMMVCSEPISLYIAYIVPMSMETFIPMLKFSYTLLTMLDRM